MPYKFTFDLSKIPRFVFTEIAKASYSTRMHKQVGKKAHEIIKKFKIEEATGLNLYDAVTLLEDLMETQARNLIERERFVQTKKRTCFFRIVRGSIWTTDAKLLSTQIFHPTCVPIALQIVPWVGQ